MYVGGCDFTVLDINSHEYGNKKGVRYNQQSYEIAAIHHVISSGAACCDDNFCNLFNCSKLDQLITLSNYHEKEKLFFFCFSGR